MVREFHTIPVHATLARAVELLLAGEQREFPVVDNLGRAEGLLTRDNLVRGLSQRGVGATVAEAMTPDVPFVPPTMPFAEALERLRGSGLPALPVVDGDGRLVGLLTRDNVADLLLVRRAGGRTRAFIGGDDTACHWGTSVRGMIQVMEKNYFAAIDYRTSTAIGLGIFGPIAFGGAFLGPLTGTPAGVAAAVSLCSAAAPAAILASRLGWPPWTGLLTPFLFPVLFYAVLNSAVVTLWHGGIRWRGTFYSLADLRRGSVR